MSSAFQANWRLLHKIMGRRKPATSPAKRVAGLLPPPGASHIRRPQPPKRKQSDEEEEEEKTDEGQKRTCTGRVGGVRQEVPDHPLSDDQKSAVAAALNKNTPLFFLTGPAGSGKTFVLRHIINRLLDEGKKVAVTAATGLAATNLEGATTLHKFAGLGGGRTGRTYNQKKEAEQNWRGVDVLVIDEISMIDGGTLDQLDKEARAYRGDASLFGGVKVIVCGDFAQLPPMADKPVFADQSEIWKAYAIEYTLICIHRQKNGDDFVRALGMIGRGLGTNEEKEEMDRVFASCFARPDTKDSVHLYAHRDSALNQNQENLERLPGQVHVFRAVDSCPRWTDETIAPSTVALKKGARVMLTKNLDVSRGLVNGALGYVTDFVGLRGPPKVMFDNGVETVIDKFKWTINNGGLRTPSTREQIPLALAWAITIHKSQGKTLDCNVIVYLDGCFAGGQAYVALSRCTDLGKLAIRVRGNTLKNARIIPGHRTAAK